MQDCSDRVDTVINDLLPKVCNKMKELSTAMAIKILDNDIHDRKWSLIINGLKGQAGENQKETRRKCIELAKNHLGVNDAESTLMSACHRLSQQKDAGIIMSL